MENIEKCYLAEKMSHNHNRHIIRLVRRIDGTYTDPKDAMLTSYGWNWKPIIREPLLEHGGRALPSYQTLFLVAPLLHDLMPRDTQNGCKLFIQGSESLFSRTPSPSTVFLLVFRLLLTNREQPTPAFDFIPSFTSLRTEYFVGLWPDGECLKEDGRP